MDKKQIRDPGKPSRVKTNAEELSNSQGLKNRILKDLMALPSMPHIVSQALDIITTEDPSLKDLVGVIETDPAIAAKILKMANSAYYGFSSKVSSLQKAAVLLGTRQLADVIMMAGTSTLLGKKLEGYGLESGDLWRHSLATAFGAKIISNERASNLLDEAFAAGLLHDIGKVILDRYILEKKEAFDEFLKDGQHTISEAEIQVLGIDHSEITYEICMSWRIPEALCNAIRYCLYPSQSNGNELAYIVHIADTLAEKNGIGIGENGMIRGLEDGAAELLGLKSEELDHIMSEMVAAVDKTIESVTKS